MRVSQILTRVRDRLDEATANTYTDVELVRYIDEGVNDMFRLQVQHDESYNNCEHNITASTDSRSLHSNITLYDVPTWVHKITSVRVKSGSGDGRELNIPARTMHNMYGSFWAYHGANRIMVRGTKAGQDLTLEVSKIPAPLNAGTLVVPASLTFSTVEIHFSQASATESLYENIYEDDWYKSALFEFTGVDAADHAIAGALTRGKQSVSVFDAVPITTVVFDKEVSAAPIAGDTWEMHAEVPSASIGYLVALAANKAFIRKSNWEAITSMATDLERERSRFIEAVTPRQDQILPYTGMTNDPVFQRDLDRDESW